MCPHAPLAVCRHGDNIPGGRAYLTANEGATASAPQPSPRVTFPTKTYSGINVGYHFVFGQPGVAAVISWRLMMEVLLLRQPTMQWFPAVSVGALSLTFPDEALVGGVFANLGERPGNLRLRDRHRRNRNGRHFSCARAP